MNARPPGRAAEIDQKLAECLGELLSIASRFDTNDLAIDVEKLARSVAHSSMRRAVMAEAVALLSLTLLRKRPDLLTAEAPARPWNTRGGYVAGQLTAGLTNHITGPSPATMATIYGRALDSITDLTGDEGIDPATTVRLIADVLKAVSTIEEDITRDPT